MMWPRVASGLMAFGHLPDTISLLAGHLSPVTVRHGMPHWPDNPPIVLERVMDLRRGDICNVSHLAMGVHSGTHMDGPVHFIHQAAGLDEMRLTATMGEARVVEIEHPQEITAGRLRPETG